MQIFCRSIDVWLTLTRILSAGGSAVSFNSTTDHGTNAAVCHVTFARTTVVPAYSQMQLFASVSRAEMNELGDALLEPEMSFVERHGLVVAHSLSRSVDSKTVVQVMNPPAPVTVYKDEKVVECCGHYLMFVQIFVQ